jgi:hypothetical protein
MDYTTINKQIVTPVKLAPEDISKIKGRDLFPRLLFNLFICSKKKSGKTSLINTIIEKCTDKRTKIIIFCSTVSKDPTYKHIVKNLDDKGYSILTFQDLYENKVNQLDEIMDILKEDDGESDSSSESEDPYPLIDADIKQNKKKRKKRKPKYLVPDILFIFDDLSSDLRDKSIANLLKVHRHYKASIIISSQYANDLMPASIRQMDHLICFGGHDEAKMEKFYKDLDLTIDFNQFYKMYKEVTKQKYQFLYTDVNDSSFRKNFNQQITLKNSL